MIDATPLHAAALAAIHAASYPPDECWHAEFFASQLLLPGHFALLSPEGAGMIMARVSADEAEVLTLAVMPERRRTGTGSALLRAAIARCARLGASQLYLEVSANNTAARALYSAVGFTGIGLRKRYYPDGSDALVLSRAAKEAM